MTKASAGIGTSSSNACWNAESCSALVIRVDDNLLNQSVEIGKVVVAGVSVHMPLIDTRVKSAEIVWQALIALAANPVFDSQTLNAIVVFPIASDQAGALG